MLKGIKNGLAIIGGLTVASMIYKGVKKFKESGVTADDLKKQGEKISDDMKHFMEKKKEEKEAKKDAEENKEAVKEEVVSEEGNKEEENNQG